MKRAPAWLLWMAAWPAAAGAQDFHVQGFLEARVPFGDFEERSGTEGGLGKARFGEDDDRFAPAGALSLSWQISSSWLAVADLQAQPQTSPELGVLAAYLRWRPVSTSAWRGSVRVGAFFPPISLENDGIGWTSRWTLTPSAINSWVGEELRTVGIEPRIEHRGAHGVFEGGFALFKWNDPAGELMATRGWALGDMTSPLGATVRQPDASGDGVHRLAYKPFVENDGRVGWHADLQWTSPSGIRLRALRYDNRAEPDSNSHQAGRTVFSWQTRFSALGAEVPAGQLVFAAQWMDGSTIIEPVEEMYFDARFKAGFLLVARERGAWRPALRYDRFRVRNLPVFPDNPFDEDGHAWTVALNWRPREWLRVTGEWLRIDVHRGQYAFEGLSPRQREQLVQLNVRYQF
jgi:hypothetical protein